jgi:cell division inhibitor SepF
MEEEQNYWDKIMDFFGLKDGLTNIANNDIMEQEKSQSKIISINRNNKKNKFKVIFHNPSSFAEVEKIVDDLKNSKAVILNLEDKDQKQARRFIDFVSGAVYGLNGNIQKIGSGVFIFTPSNIKIDGEKIKNDLKEEFLD